MNRRAVFVLSIFICQSLRAALPEHSVSPSRQFVIYGANSSLRGVVSQVAEQTKSNLLAILRQSDSWKTPIVVNLQSPQANVPELPPAALRFSQTGFGLKLQLDLTIGQNADPSLIERELLRAILLEMVYRRAPDIGPGTIYVEPPDWLLEGVLASTSGRDRQPLIGALAVSGKVMPLEELLQKRLVLLDSPGQLLFRACSFALVQLLMNEPDGHARLARYIENLSRASNDPLGDLKTYFPSLRGDLKEIWRSNVARLSSAEKYQLLSLAETEKELDELLRLKIDNHVEAIDLNRPLTIENLLERKLSSTETAAFNRSSVELLLLGTRANPLLRPIVREYQEIAALLASGKRRKLSERLARLNATRSKLSARTSDIDDYMNWFEATQLKVNSDAFADYLNAASESRTNPRRRRDPLSVYLDSLEGQF